MDGGNWCYFHSLGKAEGVPLLKNPLLHLAITIFIALPLFIADQKAASNHIRNAAYQYSDIKEGQEKQSKANDMILRKLEEMDRTYYAKLLNKYPKGYILFAIDRTEFVTPRKSRLPSEYDIDWSNASVIKSDSDWVEIKLPDIREKGRNIVVRDCVWGFTRGNSQEILSSVNLFMDEIIGESIIQSDGSMILILGFRPRAEDQ